MSEERESILLPQLEKNSYRGLFIDIEGPDGSGESTQIKALKNYFESNNLSFIVTKEPNEDCYLGKEIRRRLHDKKSG